MGARTFAGFGRFSMTTKLVAISIAVSALGVGSAGAILEVRHERRVEADAIASLSMLTRTFAAPCVAPLVFDDPIGATVVLSQLDASTLVEAAAIYDEQGERFAAHGVTNRLPARLAGLREARGMHREADTIRFVEPILLQGQQRGNLVVAASWSEIARRVQSDLGAIIGPLALVTLITAALAALLHRRLVRPVLELSRAMRRIADGSEPTERVVAQSDDEIGHLYRGYNAMLDRLETRASELVGHRGRLAALLDALPDAVFIVDGSFRVDEIHTTSASRRDGTGRATHQLAIYDVLSQDAFAHAKDAIRATLEDGATRRFDYDVVVDGNTASFEAIVVAADVHGETTRGPSVLVVARDVSERKQLEAKLLQSQKMEAVGQLAGGVAHDINNFLTPILGYTELMQRKPDRTDLRAEGFRTIIEATERCRDLIQRLLAFGRRQVFELKGVDLADEVRQVERMLRALLRENIALVVGVPDEQVPVAADVTQLQQVIVNLAVNAQDAMPQGGTLTITLGRRRKRDPEAPAGFVDEAVLTISDTGSGMSPEVIKQVFEPFFTTKPRGKGTGLGLSTVYGVVQQHRGTVDVTSELGVGTTFHIRMPIARGTAIASIDVLTGDHDIRGTETILLVEDNDSVRVLAERVLGEAGYVVLAAADGASAVSLARVHEGRIDLLVTDVVLTDVDGRALESRLLAIHPKMATLFVSGHSEETIDLGSDADVSIRLLRKPFGIDELLVAVRDVLDEHGDSAGVRSDSFPTRRSHLVAVGN